MSHDVILCLDLGNTRLKALLFEGNVPGARLDLPGDAGAAFWETELTPLIEAARGRVAFASVQPARAKTLLAWLGEKGVNPRCVDGESATPFDVSVRRRSTLGADRLCNAAAAWAESLAPAMIVDAGTAITVDLIDAAGVYLGGAILPGPHLALDALARGGAQLPEVEANWPPRFWGEVTDEALAAGALWGGLAAMEGFARRFRCDFGESSEVILTGGGGPALAERWIAGAVRLETNWSLLGLATLARHAEMLDGSENG